MDDVLLVAIVDRAEELFHNNGGVSFTVVRPLDDLIKQLTTRA